MRKVLIIEDEEAASNRLMKMLYGLNAEIRVLAILDSVSSAIKWLSVHEAPELMFVDIQLGDGNSFEIFEKAKVSCPVIFTTAYDQYALKAFKTNSIDYLLKPIKIEELRYAMEKYETLIVSSASQIERLQVIIKQMALMKPECQKRFMVQYADKIKAIDSGDIACFHSLERNTFLNTMQGKSYAISYSLEKLEKITDPDIFFRVNRGFIVNYQSIVQMKVMARSRIKLGIKGLEGQECFVSTDRVQDFKKWLNK